MNRSDRLGEEKISKLLWSLSLPSIFGMLAVSIYNIADTIFVGHSVGTLGIAAISVSLPLLMAISTFGHAIGLGGASIISRALGAKDKEKASLTLHTLVTLILIINLVVFTIAFTNLTSLLKLFGARGEILPYAYSYAVWALPGSFCLNILYVLVNQIRAEGNAKFPMISQAIGAGLNIIIDPIFIFGLGWGVMGAALATSISQFVGMSLAIWYFTMNPKSVLKIDIRKVLSIPDKKVTLETLSIGVSSFGRQIASSVMSIVLNNTLLIYGGSSAIAAFGIVFRLSMFIFMPLFGLNQGFMPIAGYNYGAKKYSRVLSAMKLANIWSTAFCVFSMICFYFFAPYLMRIFTTDKELIDIGSRALKVFILAFPVIGFQVIGSGLFQSLGKAWASLFLALSRQLLFLIPFVLIFPPIWGEKGIWYSFPVADVLAAVVTFFMVVGLVRKLKNGIDNEANTKDGYDEVEIKEYQDSVIM
jgi:putative MATE family efflux protein